ncbi:MAG: PDR/VanB family oxidoreductase [Gordonia sp. (in: high G+C Gram-positive bacteria)]
MTITSQTASRAHLHRAYATEPRTLRVVGVYRLTEEITHFCFAPDDPRDALTPYQPGSHLIVSAGEYRNAYSLTGDGMFPTSYGISVLRRGGGRGSDWLHENLSEGATVGIEGPRSMFAPVLDQRHALLVAGGIGITPILSHARAAVRDGRTADIVYSYRSGHAAHLDEIRELGDRPGITVHECHGATDTVALLSTVFGRQPLGTHAYACGPAGLLDTYQRIAVDAGWPSARVHLERFSAPEQDPGNPFTVRIASTRATIAVPSGVSLLEQLLAKGVPVPNLCRQGVCGQCRIPVRAGTLEHRDFVLSDDEKAAGDVMLCCVSRGENIEVDL